MMLPLLPRHFLAALVAVVPLVACGGNPSAAGSNAAPRAGAPSLTGCYRLTRAGGEAVASSGGPAMLTLDTVDVANRPEGLPRGDARRARLLTAKRQPAGEGAWVRTDDGIVIAGPTALLGAERLDVRVSGGRLTSAPGTPALAGYRVPCPSGAGR